MIASGHRIGIIGQGQLKLKIITGSEKIVINGITFQILHELSVPLLIGCDVLSQANLTLEQESLSLINYRIRKILTLSEDETSKENVKNEVNNEDLMLFEHVNDHCSEVEVVVVSVVNKDTGSYNDVSVVEPRVKDGTNFTRLSGLYCVQVMTHCRPIRVRGTSNTPTRSSCLGSNILPCSQFGKQACDIHFPWFFSKISNIIAGSMEEIARYVENYKLFKSIMLIR